MWARAASIVLEPCALWSVFLVSCWSVVFGSWHSCLEIRFSCLGTDTRAPFSVIVWVRGLEFARLRALMSMCVLLSCTQFVFLSAACIHVISCAVWHAACVFHWLHAFMLSCVNTWLMSFLISCVFVSCFAHGWWIVCWPCACVFVLCEHVVSVLFFCVPCALMSYVLNPSILLPVYW